jgi:hypothetical protein
MLSLVSLVGTDVSEELSAPIITVTRIGELGTTFAVTSTRRALRRNITLADSCHSDDGGAQFIRNVCYYKIHTA